MEIFFNLLNLILNLDKTKEKGELSIPINLDKG
jgi:hypothetical protein